MLSSSSTDLSGKVALLTIAGSDAIGEDIIAQLLLSNIAKIYVLAKTQDVYAAVVEELSIRQDLSQDTIGTEYVSCDLASIPSCADAAQDLLTRSQQLQRLDLFFCHASTPASDANAQAEDGIDTSFAIGYLGHFVLLNLLLPLIEQTAANLQQARIIVSASYLYALDQTATLETLTTGSTSNVSPAANALSTYSRSQLAKILLTRYLAKLEHAGKGLPVFANSFDATDIQPDLLGTSLSSIPAPIFRKNGSSPDAAAAVALYLATSQDVADHQISGQYFGALAAQSQLDGVAADNDLMNNLWYWSDHRVTEVLGKGWENTGTEVLANAAPSR